MKQPPQSRPHVDESRIWAGRGSGKLCVRCHRPILADDIEYEVGVVNYREMLHQHRADCSNTAPRNRVLMRAG